MWSINATMQSRAVTVSRYHASQLPQPLPQYYTMIGRGAADDDDADLCGCRHFPQYTHICICTIFPSQFNGPSIAVGLGVSVCVPRQLL